MIELLFTTSPKNFSKLARWALKSDCSHFAVNFDNGIVFHSNFLGAHIEPYQVFAKENFIIHRLRFCDMPLKDEEMLYQKLINIEYGKGYDFGAMLFLGLNLISLRFRDDYLFKFNLWNTKDYLICTEILECLSGMEFSQFTFPIIDNIAMKKPHDLYLELKSLPFLIAS